MISAFYKRKCGYLLEFMNSSMRRRCLTTTTAPTKKQELTTPSTSPSPPPQKVCKGKAAPVAELGQPTFWTHAHLFETSSSSSVLGRTDFNKQVTPGITKQEFETRRATYMSHLLAYQKYYFQTKQGGAEGRVNKKSKSTALTDHNVIAIIPSSVTTHNSPDVMHPFKQNSDLLYLTGFKEPNSCLVLSRSGASDDPNSSNPEAYRAALFCADKNAKRELWEGPNTGPGNVEKLTGIQHAYSINDLPAYLASLAKETTPGKSLCLWRYPTEQVMAESGPNCYNSLVEDALDTFVDEAANGNGTLGNKLIDMSKLEAINSSQAASYFNSSRYFSQLCRVRKSQAELASMREACEISSRAFEQSMRVSHPHINEHLLYAKFDFDCRVRGAETLAYIPVIAGGTRATTLHYIRNNQVIDADSMVLMDAGCQFRDYSADITRTWPISGSFKRGHKDLYEACLNVQRHCLSHVRPGVSIQQLYFAMMRSLSAELVELGIIRAKDHEQAIKPSDSPLDSFSMGHLQKLTAFCPHDVGHYLGLDVHDCPEVSKHVALEKGAVITIEPGIYVRPDDESVPFKYRGIGIRIEDDVAVTDEGIDILSASCPKTIEEIEKITLKS